jgi:hypothetical protein
VVRFRVKVTRVRTPTIGVEVRQAKGLQQRLEREKHLIFPTTEDIRQDHSRAMINGMPEPTLVVFVADIHGVERGRLATLRW